jgi:hypothetical protein
MRPTRFPAEALTRLLHRREIATMGDLKAALGTSADMTVFRKLRELDYISSYSHRGGFYALRETAAFDQRGLWSVRSVHFSQFGSLLDTATEVVSHSEQGYWAAELAEELGVPVKDALLQLVERHRLIRDELAGLYLYLSADPDKRRDQKLHRQAAIATAVPVQTGPSGEAQALDEIRAALLLFYSLLDEQQRRLFAGLESLRLGRGGDRRIAELLSLDVHTVGRGRKALADWDLQVDRVRRPGGGRPRLEKKPQK